MSSFYRFSISRNGSFYFSVDDKFSTRDKALTMLADFVARYPVSEGFKVELARWSVSGIIIA